MYSLTIELPIMKTDANRTKGFNRFIVHKTFKSVKDQISILTLGKRPAKPLTKFQISVKRLSPRTLDYDNLISSLKPHLDGLKLAKIIHDDSWKFIKFINVDQELSQDKKLIIEVEGL